MVKTPIAPQLKPLFHDIGWRDHRIVRHGSYGAAHPSPKGLVLIS